MGVYKHELTGKRFGRLLVINESGRSKAGDIYWKCVCDCGNVSKTTSSALVSGNTKSCGCLHKEIVGLSNGKGKLKLVGQKFGRLLVISETNKKTSDGHYKWECLCDCGKKIFVGGNLLKRGNTRSCGCLAKNGRKKRKDDYGIIKNDLALFDTYAKQLYCEEVTINKENGLNLLSVRCAYCGDWFCPSRTQTKNRLLFLNGHTTSENRLYCSENCKQACPIYNQKMYPKGFKHTTSREVSPYLRQMVFERDNWTCQICGRNSKEVQLHCHHMDPVAQNPMFQNDMNSCITLCKDCHKMVHRQYGCRYVDLQCKQPPVTKNPDYPRRHS